MNAIGIKKKISKLQLISEPAVGAQLQLKDICANDFQLSFAAQSFLFSHSEKQTMNCGHVCTSQCERGFVWHLLIKKN